MIFWRWLQLFMFNLSNQALHPEEDQINKKDRPLPSGRISQRTVTVLRWLIPLFNLAWSAQYSKEVVLACLAGCFLTWVHNEAGFMEHWAGRNICCALGMASFEIGASLIAGELLSLSKIYTSSKVEYES